MVGKYKFCTHRLNLREINIRNNKRDQDCKHPELVENTAYLGKVNGYLYILTAHKQWYGWNMYGWLNDVGIQLNHVDQLWEIIGMEVMTGANEKTTDST